MTFNRTKLINSICSIVLLSCSFLPTSIVDKIGVASVNAGIHTDVALFVAKNESNYNPFIIGDMNIICSYGPNKGKPVRARGLYQITDCSHPEITDAQAFDADWSIAWAIPRLADYKTCRKEWTTCRWYYLPELAEK